MNQNRKLLVFVVFILLFVFGLSLLTGNRLFYSRNFIYGDTNVTNALGDSPVNPDDENHFKYFPMLQKAYFILKKEYVLKSKVTSKNLIYGAIKGMLNSLNDPYTSFMDPDATKDFYIDMNAKFGGVGIYIDLRDGWLTVVSPIEDTPAFKAGIKPNDKIVEIEGVSTRNISSDEAVSKLRGKPGSVVNIKISRKGIDEPFSVSLVREEINIKTVKSDIIEDNNHEYGYIKITQFSLPTADELQTQIQKILEKKPEGLIIDLRNNPGGSLSVVVNCVDQFLDQGLIVYTRGRLSENNSDYFASKNKTIVPASMPVVVLINQGSASASEIFAGAMQDTHRGVLIGMKSFGKGSVQKTFAFPEDGSLIKYTVAKYFTPAGRLIDQIGLQPDLEEKNWYEKISEQEQNTLLKIQQTNFIKEFLSSNPRPQDSDVQVFRKSLESKGFAVTMPSIKWLIYLKQHESDIPGLFDLTFDDQLKKSLDVMSKYSDYSKAIKYYEDTK